MPQPITENRSGPRYIAAFPVLAEWDTDDGVHVVAEGETENVGPEGTLIHLQRDLPPVGGRVNLLVLGDDGEKLRVIAEVLRRVAAYELRMGYDLRDVPERIGSLVAAGV